MAMLDQLLKGALGGMAGGGAQGGGMMQVLAALLADSGGGGGGLGALAGALGGGGGAGGGGLGALAGALGGGAGGGLGGLVQQFQKAGLGDHVNSWVGTGQNMPISPDQLTQVFGQAPMQQMAQHAGMEPGQFGGALSQLLPQVVDHLTPHGQVPQGGIDAGDLMGVLGKMMGR